MKLKYAGCHWGAKGGRDTFSDEVYFIVPIYVRTKNSMIIPAVENHPADKCTSGHPVYFD